MSKRGIFGSNKIWRYPERMSIYLSSGAPAPVTMELDMTNACPHRCPGCAGGRDAAVSLKLSEAKDWVEQMADFGVKGLVFTGGGEPLMHAATPHAVEFANRCGLEVGLITNGALLWRLGAEEMLALVGSCTWIRVSLDASDEAMFERKHGVSGEHFERVCSGIAALSHGRENGTCTIGVGYLTDAGTKRGMLTATRLVKSLGADYIQFRPYHWDRTPIDDVLPLCRQEETEAFRVTASEQKYARFAEWPVRDYGFCHGCFWDGTVQADGNMALCCHMRGKPKYYIGSLHEQRLADIWGGERHREVARRTDVSKCVPFCRNDHINRQLDDVMTAKEHEAFL